MRKNILEALESAAFVVVYKNLKTPLACMEYHTTKRNMQQYSIYDS